MSKLYKVLVSYLEPTQAEISLYAKSEEEAINIILDQSEKLVNVKIETIQDMGEERPDNYVPDFKPKIIN